MVVEQHTQQRGDNDNDDHRVLSRLSAPCEPFHFPCVFVFYFCLILHFNLFFFLVLLSIRLWVHFCSFIAWPYGKQVDRRKLICCAFCLTLCKRVLCGVFRECYFIVVNVSVLFRLSEPRKSLIFFFSALLFIAREVKIGWEGESGEEQNEHLVCAFKRLYFDYSWLDRVICINTTFIQTNEMFVWI